MWKQLFYSWIFVHPFQMAQHTDTIQSYWPVMQSSATLPDNAGFPHNASEIWDGTELIELLVSGVAYSLDHCWTVLLLNQIVFNPFVKRKSWKMIYDIFSILLLCSRRCDAIGLQLVIYKITPIKLLEWYPIALCMFSEFLIP